MKLVIHLSKMLEDIVNLFVFTLIISGATCSVVLIGLCGITLLDWIFSQSIHVPVLVLIALIFSAFAIGWEWITLEPNGDKKAKKEAKQ